MAAPCLGTSIGLQRPPSSRRRVCILGGDIARALQQRSRKTLRDLVSRLLDRVSRKVSIPSRRLHLRVAQELANHGQPLADSETTRSERVPKVVDAGIV